MSETAGHRSNQKRSEQDQQKLLDKIKANGKLTNTQNKKLKNQTMLDAMRKLQEENELLHEQVKRISANSTPTNSPPKSQNFFFFFSGVVKTAWNWNKSLSVAFFIEHLFKFLNL